MRIENLSKLAALYKFVKGVQAKLLETSALLSIYCKIDHHSLFIRAVLTYKEDMFKIISKLIGMIALAMTVITAVLDLTRSIANSALTITTLGEQWADIHRDSLLLIEPAIARHIHPFLWNPVIQNILLSPSWLVFGVIAIIFLWFGRSKDRRWRQRFGS